MAGFWDSFAPQASADAAAGGLGMLQGLIQGPQVAQKMNTVDLHNALLQAQAMLAQKKQELAGGPQLMKFAPNTTFGMFDPRSKSMGPLTTTPNPQGDLLSQMRQDRLQETKDWHKLLGEQGERRLSQGDQRLSLWGRDPLLAAGFQELFKMTPQEWLATNGTIPPDMYNKALAQSDVLRQRQSGAKESGRIGAVNADPLLGLKREGVGDASGILGRDVTMTPPSPTEFKTLDQTQQAKKIEVAGAMAGATSRANAENRPLTESEANSNIYATRAESADALMNALEGKYSPALVNRKVGVGQAPVIGGILEESVNIVLPPNEQKAEQAQRNFVNAVLRKESGAVINQDEFNNARKQYFPQPGDGPEVLAQKRANRRIVIDGLKAASGKAGRVAPGPTQPKDWEPPNDPKMKNSTSLPPPVGVVRKGYRFKGGNPADQKNWEKVK